MRKILIASVAAAAMSMPGLAQADDMYHHNNPGMYFGLGLGANFLEDSDIENFAGLSPETSSEVGIAGALTFGYRFSNGIRLEAEGAIRNNNLDEVDIGAPFDIGQGGHLTQYSLMGNLLYDFQLGSWFSPYIGAGVGFVHHSGGGDLDINGAQIGDSDINDTVFAYQFIAGASAQFGSGWEGFLDYRYFASERPDADVDLGGGFPGELDYTNHNHTVMMGVRYVFWSPKPMMAKPEPVAQPEPEKPMAPKVEARSYLVFFDWDSAELTPEAMSVIRAAADNIKRGGVSTLKVQVTGHADRSGAASYNVGLSERRADVVRDSLVSMGVSNGVIGVDWKGETDPLVQTEDGVREPQNRRASIEVAT